MEFGQMILNALLPIFVIMLLGYLSGKTNAFTGENARSFNKLVLNYALPAALFLSIVKAETSVIRRFKIVDYQYCGDSCLFYVGFLRV